MPRILVVDDEPAICWGIQQLAIQLGHEVEVAASAEQGWQLAGESRFDLLFLDVRLPGIDGLTAIPRFRQSIDSAPIVVMTAFGELETAICAVQNGAFEYLLKPFDLAEVRATINRAFSAASSPSSGHDVRPYVEMLGKTPVMKEVFKRIALAASSDVSVLLLGEFGVGKEEAARAIHRHSTRSKHPFVVVDLENLSPTVAEAELFGQVLCPSAESLQSRLGLLAKADGGTLYLKEITAIPLSVQAKLMRVLDQSEVLPLGAQCPSSTTFRVIAGTEHDLATRVHSGEFRQDLFYRLSGIEISLPPLRERVDDIPLLAQHFATSSMSENVSFTEKTQKSLLQRMWYGNLCELREAVHYAVGQASGKAILPSHLPEPWLRPSGERDSKYTVETLEQLIRRRATDLLSDPENDGLVYERLLEEIEPALLQSAMDRFANEYAPAARALGLHRTTLKRKLDQYRLAK